MEYVLTQPAGVLILPATGAPRCGVLVLSGCSGRIEVDRARLLAAHGAAAICLRWFGGAGQSPGICEVALETFRPALDRLAGLSDRLAVLGACKGAEAALLLAVGDPRIAAIGAFSPTSVVWANVGSGVDGSAYPYRSSWTDAGVPVPFVPYDEAWQPSPGLPAYRGLYEQSLRTSPTARRRPGFRSSASPAGSCSPPAGTTRCGRRTCSQSRSWPGARSTG